MLPDLRLALRTLAKARGFAAIAALTLAVGIGGATAMFSVLRALVVEPFTYPEPDRLVQVWSGDYWPLSGPDFIDVDAKMTAFEEFGVYTPRTANVGTEKPEAVNCVFSTAGALRAFGVPPQRGRWLEPADNAKGAAPVAVISHGLWQRLFQGDPNLVGTSVRINGGNTTVVGIMPEKYEFTGPWIRTSNIDLWLPLTLEFEPNDRGSHWLSGIARLRAGVSPGAADAEIKAIGVELTQQYPDSNTRKAFLVRPLLFEITRDVGSKVWMLFGAVSLVLLVACANVASMLLARNAQRQGEFGLRVALGATRRAIVRLALVESGLLALSGSVLGLAFAVGGIQVLRVIAPASEARRAAMALDVPTVLFALGATLLVAVLAGLPPAWAAMRTTTDGVIRGGGRGAVGSRTRHHLLRGLIIAQVAVAFILANVAALFSSSYLKLLAENENLSSENVLSAALNLNGDKYETNEDRVRFWQQLIERTEALPGVTAAGLTTKLPLNGGSNTNTLVNDETYDPTQQRISVERSSITPGYFAAMGLTLLQGRNLETADGEGEVTGVVVNRAMVDKAWPDKNPIGEMMRANNPGKPWYQSRVVGVVENVRQWSAEQPPQPEMYTMPPGHWGGGRVYLVVRSPQPVGGLVPLLQHEVAALDPELALTEVRTMHAVVGDATKGNRAIAGLVNFFMAAALGLVAVGLYGTLSYHVLQRTREIGVRLAMGAQQRDILGLVFLQGSRWVGLGVSLGIAGTIGLSFVLHSMVYGVDQWSVSPLALATVAVGVSAMIACWLPARRAAKLDPNHALRAD